MNYFDIIVIIPLIWGFYKGFKTGLIIELATLVALGLGTWGALHFSGFVSDWMKNDMHWEFRHIYLASFIITFLAIVIAIYFGAKLLETVIKIALFGIINRIFGGIFGVAKYFLLLSVILIIINKADAKQKFINEGTKHDSFFYKPLVYVSEKLYSVYLERI